MGNAVHAQAHEGGTVCSVIPIVARLAAVKTPTEVRPVAVPSVHGIPQRGGVPHPSDSGLRARSPTVAVGLSVDKIPCDAGLGSVLWLCNVVAP